jgi:hypothetical protein
MESREQQRNEKGWTVPKSEKIRSMVYLKDGKSLEKLRPKFYKEC